MSESANDATALEILRIDERWIEAFNAGDVEALASAYDQDAIVMPPGRPEIRGRAAIREWLSGFFAANRAHQRLVNDEVVVCGSWAFMRGRFVLEIAPHDGEPQRLVGKHLVVWRRRDAGGWSAARDIWNLDG